VASITFSAQGDTHQLFDSSNAPIPGTGAALLMTASLTDAAGTLRRFLRDGVDDFFYLPDRALGEAELHETGLAQRALISASVANSPRAISASASARSARSSAVKRITGWSAPAS